MTTKLFALTEAIERFVPNGSRVVLGTAGLTKQTSLASKHIIVTAEEIVDAAVIRSDPQRVVLPPFKVSAVCHVPWGAHPSPVPGYYNRDHAAFLEYQQASRTTEMSCGATWHTDLLDVMSVLQQGLVDLSFIGGAEIDRFGNINTTAIGPHDRPTVRLPGSGGGCDLASLATRFLAIMAHEPRRFVERVNYITSPGYGEGGTWRHDMGLTGGGPSAVITTLGILRFEEQSKEMYLHSVHPGVTVEEVQAATGWDLRITSDLQETPPPTADELRLLRQFDPQGFWTGATS